MRIRSFAATVAVLGGFVGISMTNAPSALAVPQAREVTFAFHVCQSDYTTPDNIGPGNSCTFLSPGGVFLGVGPYTISWTSDAGADGFHCPDGQGCGDVKNVPAGAVVTMSADGPAAFVQQVCITECLST
jgi:hypothetical protein